MNQDMMQLVFIGLVKRLEEKTGEAVVLTIDELNSLIDENVGVDVNTEANTSITLTTTSAVEEESEGE